jgi:hypothetical protein
MAESKIRQVTITDPRHERETFINAPVSLYVNDGMMYLTLGVERPLRNSATSGPSTAVEHEVVLRLVMSLRVAGIVADVMQKQIAALAHPIPDTVKQ